MSARKFKPTDTVVELWPGGVQNARAPARYLATEGV